ncbi:MAG TPA: efflux RND transporter periplasmic adaptor subunit [Gemmataceae bacterium]|nr:efflux RND transporter periplasmic adaptor subunit [Gemmataceae bacterium]
MRTLMPLLCLLPLLCAGLARGDEGASGEPTTMFRTAPVERGSLTAAVQAKGTLQPEDVVEVGAQVAGQVEKLTADFNTPVEAGTVLAQIDPSLYQVRVDQARAGLRRAEANLQVLQARLEQAERDVQRVQKLVGQRAVSEEEVQTARSKHDVSKAEIEVGKADVETARAALKEAEINLGYTTIKSPIRGVILDRRVDVGHYVASSLNAPSLFVIAKDLKRMQVWIAVNEADIGPVREGQNVRFSVATLPKLVFAAKVGQIRLNAALTQNVVTYTVVANVDNREGKLLPYLTADVQVVVGERENVLLVPNAALRWRPSREQVAPDAREAFDAVQARKESAGREPGERGVVWVEDKGHVRPVKVRLGLSDGTRTEIVDGDVKEGTPLVTGLRSPE